LSPRFPYSSRQAFSAPPKQSSEIHKSKISKEESEKQLVELDERTDEKKVYQYDLDDKFIASFKSVNDAYRFLGKKYGGSIGTCCNGKSKQCLGYIWKWH